MRRRRKQMYPERNSKIVHMFMDGKTYTQIAEELSITRGVVAGAIDRARKIRTSLRSGPRKTREQIERNAKIIKQLNCGKTYSSVAKDLGVSKNVVVGVVYRHNKRNKQ